MVARRKVSFVRLIIMRLTLAPPTREMVREMSAFGGTWRAAPVGVAG
jgi:hypothetical protein